MTQKQEEIISSYFPVNISINKSFTDEELKTAGSIKTKQMADHIVPTLLQINPDSIAREVDTKMQSIKSELEDIHQIGEEILLEYMKGNRTSPMAVMAEVNQNGAPTPSIIYIAETTEDGELIPSMFPPLSELKTRAMTSSEQNSLERAAAYFCIPTSSLAKEAEAYMSKENVTIILNFGEKTDDSDVGVSAENFFSEWSTASTGGSLALLANVNIPDYIESVFYTIKNGIVISAGSAFGFINKDTLRTSAFGYELENFIPLFVMEFIPDFTKNGHVIPGAKKMIPSFDNLASCGFVGSFIRKEDGAVIEFLSSINPPEAKTEEEALVRHCILHTIGMLADKTAKHGFRSIVEFAKEDINSYISYYTMANFKTSNPEKLAFITKKINDGIDHIIAQCAICFKVNLESED